MMRFRVEVMTPEASGDFIVKAPTVPEAFEVIPMKAASLGYALIADGTPVDYRVTVLPEADWYTLLVSQPSDEYEPPAPFGPFPTVEAAQEWAERFRVANDLPREATPENNETWTDAGWYFGIFPLHTDIEVWSK